MSDFKLLIINDKEISIKVISRKNPSCLKNYQ